MKRGDIVLAHFPHARGTMPKRRPVLVVQADYYNQKISNVLVASITSNLARRNDPAHYFVGLSSSEGKLSGLTQLRRFLPKPRHTACLHDWTENRRSQCSRDARDR